MRIEHPAPSAAVTMRQGDEIQCGYRAVAPGNIVDNLHLLISELRPTPAVADRAFLKALKLVIDCGLDRALFPRFNRIVKELDAPLPKRLNLREVHQLIEFKICQGETIDTTSNESACHIKRFDHFAPPIFAQQ